MSERELRKAQMQVSNWVAAAEGGAREYNPVSTTPLSQAYQRSKSITRSEYLGRLSSQGAERAMARDTVPPAASWIARKHTAIGEADTMYKANIVLGTDPDPPSQTELSNSAYGKSLKVPMEEIDLLQSVPKLRDTTLDGSHRASMTEGHFLSIWDPYLSMHRNRSASYTSAAMLRDQHQRHVRSQYHPEEKYVLPPTVQNEIGWGLDLEKYQQSCAKFQEGAEWHGRVGSHITKFSERLLLGARHHLSGPSTKTALHY